AKRDALAAAFEGQPPAVIDGSGERRYDDLAAADREAQARLSGCWGDSADGDPGMAEGRRYRRIDDASGALTDHRRVRRNVRGRGRRARTRATGCRGTPTRGVAAARTAAAGRYDQSGSHDHRDGR